MALLAHMRHQHSLRTTVERRQDVARLTAGHTHQHCRAHRASSQDQCIQSDAIKGRVFLVDDHEVEAGGSDDFPPAA